MSAAQPVRVPRFRDVRLLRAALGYEVRKVTTWRAGFILREVER